MKSRVLEVRGEKSADLRRKVRWWNRRFWKEMAVGLGRVMVSDVAAAIDFGAKLGGGGLLISIL